MQSPFQAALTRAERVVEVFETYRDLGLWEESYEILRSYQELITGAEGSWRILRNSHDASSRDADAARRLIPALLALLDFLGRVFIYYATLKAERPFNEEEMSLKDELTAILSEGLRLLDLARLSERRE
jgi:hypothetical protein